MPKPDSFLHRRARAAMRGLALAGAVTALPLAAQDDATSDATAEVILPATLEVIENLDFGPLIAGTGGAMTINSATNATSSVGGVTIAGTTAHRATFRSQLPIGVIVFFLGDPTVTLTRQGGTETMTANLTYSTGSGLIPGPFLGTRRSSLAEQFYYAGGTLLVANGQASGLYEGTFTFSIDNL